MSDHIWNFVGHEQILVGQWPMTDSYLQPCNIPGIPEWLLKTTLEQVFSGKNPLRPYHSVKGA